MARPKKKATRKRPRATTGKYAQVEVKRFRVADITDAPYNPRTVTQRALAGLTRSLVEFGLLALPVVNVAGSKTRLVGGHQRMKIIRARGDAHVYCVVVRFDPATEKKANLTLNNEEIEGRFIPEMTKAMIDAIQAQAPDAARLMKGLNFDSLVRRINRQLAPDEPPARTTTPAGPAVDEEEVPRLASSTRSTSTKGALYTLGNHVIHCGPPTLRGSMHGFPVTTASVGIMEFVGTNVPSDEFFSSHLGRLLKDTHGGVYVVTTLPLLPHVQRAFLRLGGHWSSTVLWLDSKALPIPEQPYAHAVIPVVYGWKKGRPHPFYGGKAQGNVFNLKRRPATPHMPVEIAVRCLMLSSEMQGWVFDPDAGHGATLIAAERMQRRLLGYVRTPRECDRLRKRWAEFVHGRDASWRSLAPQQG